jgi:HEAT repeat protein
MVNEQDDPKHHASTTAVRNARKARDIPTLLTALRDPLLTALAARYLGEIGASEAAHQLIGLLDSDDPHIRANAATALGLLKEERAGDELLRIAQGDPVPWVRSWALGAHTSIAGSSGVSALLSALNDADWRVRRSALNGLATVADGRVLQRIALARKRDRLLKRPAYLRTAVKIRRSASARSRSSAPSEK